MDCQTTATLSAADQWRRDIEAHDAAELAMHRAVETQAPDDELEALGDRVTELFSRLLNQPAPHATALLWKIETLLKIDGVSSGTSIWMAETVAQTLTDAREMLGGHSMTGGTATKISALAGQIGDHAMRVNCLAASIAEQASEVTDAMSDRARGRERTAEAIDRLHIFSSIIRDSASVTGERADQIEFAAFRDRRR